MTAAAAPPPLPGPRRVLMTADAVGGVWQYATTLARGLAPLGTEVLLAVLGRAPAELPADLRIIADGLPLDWVGSSAAETRTAAAHLAGLAAREGCALVHLNSPVLAAAADWPAPVLAMAHGCVTTWWAATRGTPLDAAFAWHREMSAAGLCAADVAAAPTAAYAAMLRAAYGLSRAVAVVHNGRDPRPAHEAPPANFAVTAGRLWDEAKGAAVLDAAAGRTAHPILAAGAGDGPNGERFAAAHLRTLGSLDGMAMAALLAQRPVFASAARFEPFGLAVLEAAQAGCALVVADIPTFRELWDGAARFVPAEDAPAFAAAINGLFADPAARTRLAACARARAMRYTVPAMAEETARLYAGMVPAHVSSPAGRQRAAA